MAIQLTIARSGNQVQVTQKGATLNYTPTALSYFVDSSGFVLTRGNLQDNYPLTDVSISGVVPADGTAALAAMAVVLSSAAGGGKTVLAADVANSAADTLADVTGLSFPVVAGANYKFRAFVVFSAAATTTGSRWSVNGPANTRLVYNSEYPLDAVSATWNKSLGAYNLPAAANASSASTTNNIAIIEGIITPSANGTLIVRFASEVNASAITAKAGVSYITYEIV